MKFLDLKNETDWLKYKSMRISASEAAAILGISKYRTALDVYADKRTAKKSDDNDLFWFGHAMENVTADFFERKTGKKLTDPGDYTILPSPRHDWLISTLDRYTDDNIPVELKTVNDGTPLKKWQSEPPIDNEVQMQIQMYCCDADHGYLVATGFRYAQLGVIRLERNDRFLDHAIPILERFKKEIMDAGKPPAPTEQTKKESIKNLFEETGSTAKLGQAELDLANEIEEERGSISAAQKRKSQAEKLLRFAIGNNSFGKLPDGTFIKIKNNRMTRTRRYC